MTGTASDSDAASASRRSVPRRLRAPVGLFGVAGLVYLGVCAVLLVWALVVTARDSSDESMAGVIPLLATAPTSLVLLVLPDNDVMLIPAITFGALVNAAIIGWCARTLRRGGRTD